MILTHKYDIAKAAAHYAEAHGFRMLPIQARGKLPTLKE
jgi:hypothetical protein